MSDWGRVGPEMRSGEVSCHQIPKVLKNLGTYFAAELPKDRHVITANEGAAVGMVIGHHLRTGEIATVYMQNSGIGNAIKPLLSLADPDVYSIPMVLIVGWRGRPGENDEPQHLKQGRVTESLLSAMELPYFTLPRDVQGGCAVVQHAVDIAKARQGPVVVLVEKDTFDHPRIDAPFTALVPDLPSREEALHAVVDAVGRGAAIVAATGMLSRELFEYRAVNSVVDALDFLTVGGMGHASSIALGVALRQPGHDVWCLDGDGALLMHAGTLAVAGQLALHSFFHVVFNNGVHDSMGGQATAIGNVDVAALALAAGYRNALSIQGLGEIAPAVEDVRSSLGPALIEVMVRPGARPDLSRPLTTPVQNKGHFMANVNRAAARSTQNWGPL